MSNHKVIENWGDATLLYVLFMIIDHKTYLTYLTKGFSMSVLCKTLGSKREKK